MTNRSFDDILDLVTLEKRFSFIDNAVLRQNVTVCFQYIIFLTVAQEKYKGGGSIELSLYRDMVVHTASIIESCLHYAITELIRLDRYDAAHLEGEWEFREAKDIYTVSPTEKIVWGKRIKEAKVLKDKPMSKDINSAARRMNLLDDDLHEKAENLREMRNNIHIIGPNKEIVYPSKADITQIYEDSSLILSRIETTLEVSALPKGK